LKYSMVSNSLSLLDYSRTLVNPVKLLSAKLDLKQVYYESKFSIILVFMIGVSLSLLDLSVLLWISYYSYPKSSLCLSYSFCLDN